MSSFFKQGFEPRGDLETNRGLYRKYHWKPGVIAANIRAHHLTALFPVVENPHPTVASSCSICYNYFPQLNETKCCRNHLCTECIAATVAAPGEEQICPLCRGRDFTVTPNLTPDQLSLQDTDDSAFTTFQSTAQLEEAMKHERWAIQRALALSLQDVGSSPQVYGIVAG
jgi:hypothetical protein